MMTELVPEQATVLDDTDLLPDDEHCHAVCAACYPYGSLHDLDIFTAVCGRRAIVRKGMLEPRCERCIVIQASRSCPACGASW